MSNQQMTAHTASSVMTTWEEKLETVKKMVDPKGKLNVPEFEAFCYQAKRTGLDPLARQIYFTKQADKVSVCATIDGLRLVAQRSKNYQGQVGPYWCGKDGKWTDVWLEKAYPAAAKVGVNHADFKETLWAVATWDQYCPIHEGKPGFMWNKMSSLMIGKCAEALALRKAFPQELSGVYAQEEMEQAGAVAPMPHAAETPVEPGRVIDEERQAKAGEEDQRPENEQRRAPLTPKSAEPDSGDTYLASFKRDGAAAEDNSKLNELWEGFRRLIRGANLSQARVTELDNAGWTWLKTEKARRKPA